MWAGLPIVRGKAARKGGGESRRGKGTAAHGRPWGMQESGNHAQRHLQAVPVLRRDRFQGAACVLANRSTEVFVQGIERIGPNLGESSSEGSFNPIDRMKEISAVHFETAGAELPVRTQQEVNPEEAMIFFIEHAPAHQTEVGHVFFLFPGVNTTPAWAAAKLPGNRSEVRPGGGAIPKTAHAGPKNGPKNAVARRVLRLVDNAGSVAFAILAGLSRQRNRIRSIPLH